MDILCQCIAERSLTGNLDYDLAFKFCVVRSSMLLQTHTTSFCMHLSQQAEISLLLLWRGGLCQSGLQREILGAGKQQIDCHTRFKYGESNPRKRKEPETSTQSTQL